MRITLFLVCGLLMGGNSSTADVLSLWERVDPATPHVADTPAESERLLSPDSVLAANSWSVSEVGSAGINGARSLGESRSLVNTGRVTRVRGVQITNDALEYWEAGVLLARSEIDGLAITSRGLNIGSLLMHVNLGDVYRLGMVLFEIDGMEAVRSAPAGVEM